MHNSTQAAFSTRINAYCSIIFISQIVVEFSLWNLQPPKAGPKLGQVGANFLMMMERLGFGEPEVLKDFWNL